MVHLNQQRARSPRHSEASGHSLPVQCTKRINADSKQKHPRTETFFGMEGNEAKLEFLPNTRTRGNWLPENAIGDKSLHCLCLKEVLRCTDPIF